MYYILPTVSVLIFLFYIHVSIFDTLILIQTKKSLNVCIPFVTDKCVPFVTVKLGLFWGENSCNLHLMI